MQKKKKRFLKIQNPNFVIGKKKKNGLQNVLLLKRAFGKKHSKTFGSQMDPMLLVIAI